MTVGATGERCAACGGEEGFEELQVREMLQGTRESFRYLRCTGCGTLQIAEVPADLSRFYGPDYYSFAIPQRSRLRRWLKACAARQRIERSSPLGALLLRLFAAPELLERVARSGVTFTSRILEVGCGAGKNLFELRDMGFRHLEGVDPFVPEARHDGSGLRIHKCELAQIEGRYDLILLNDVFEHLPHPEGALAHCVERLRPGGTILLRTPLADSEAFERYGVDWVQLDAPRHLFVHTRAGLGRLAERCGLELRDVFFDSTDFQFWGSELYRGGEALWTSAGRWRDGRFSKAEMRAFRQRTRELNLTERGDAACFYLRRERASTETAAEPSEAEDCGRVAIGECRA